MKRKQVEVKDIVFWNDNPREPLNNDWDDEYVINHYKQNEKLDDLIKSIKKYDLVEEIIGMQEGKLVKVYDGNRRVAAMKELLRDNYYPSNHKISVKIYDDYQKVLEIINEIHGTGTGANRRRWSPLQRDRFNERANFKLNSPRAFKVIKASKHQNYSAYYQNKYVDYTTLERILYYPEVIDALEKIESEFHLKFLIDVAKKAKKKIDSRNSNSRNDFSRNFGDTLNFVFSEYQIVQTGLWDNDPIEMPTPKEDSKEEEPKKDSKEEEPKEDSKEEEPKKDSKEEEPKEDSKEEEPQPYVVTTRNNPPKRSYKFFDYSNMERPTLDVGSLTTCVTNIGTLNINEKIMQTRYQLL